MKILEGMGKRGKVEGRGEGRWLGTPTNLRSMANLITDYVGEVL